MRFHPQQYLTNLQIPGQMNALSGIRAYYPALHEDNIQVPLYHQGRRREEAGPTVPIGIREEAGPIVPLGKKL